MIRDHSLYTTAKGGLEALTQQLAFEYAPRFASTRSLPPRREPLARTNTTRSNDEKWRALIPMGRVGRPEDYVGSVVFLASELSAFMTGELLHIDGAGRSRATHRRWSTIFLASGSVAR